MRSTLRFRPRRVYSTRLAPGRDADPSTVQAPLEPSTLAVAPGVDPVALAAAVLTWDVARVADELGLNPRQALSALIQVTARWDRTARRASGLRRKRRGGGDPASDRSAASGAESKMSVRYGRARVMRSRGRRGWCAVKCGE
jgi:hypothetical protein